MGTRYNRLAEAVQTCTHDLCLSKCIKKYQNFTGPGEFFTAEKNLCILHGQVFVLKIEHFAIAYISQTYHK